MAETKMKLIARNGIPEETVVHQSGLDFAALCGAPEMEMRPSAQVTCPRCLEIIQERSAKRRVHLRVPDGHGTCCGGMQSGEEDTSSPYNTNCLECLMEWGFWWKKQANLDVQLSPSQLDTLRALHADALAAQRVALQSRRKTKQARRRSQRCAEALDKALAAEELAQLELERIEAAFEGETRGTA